MADPARRFLYGIAASILGGAAAFGAVATGRIPHADPLHFLAVGTGAYALGYFLVRSHAATLAPDPAMRKGIAPRAFWTLAAGLVARGLAGANPDPQKESFAAAASLAGVMLEAGALGMLLYGAFAMRAPAKVAPAAPVGATPGETGKSEAPTAAP